ncbi:hypothetical protein CCR91_05300 [Thiorhodovibrio winogradskyi]|nr:hypothetical protein [Thiorhodovibrio winogradskyi]
MRADLPARADLPMPADLGMFGDACQPRKESAHFCWRPFGLDTLAGCSLTGFEAVGGEIGSAPG